MDLEEHIHHVQKEVKGHLEKAKEGYERHADKHGQQGPTYLIGQKMWLSVEHLLMDRPSQKPYTENTFPHRAQSLPPLVQVQDQEYIVCEVSTLK